MPSRDLTLFTGFTVDPKDTFIIRGSAGIAVAHVKKPDGQVYTQRVRINGGFQQNTHFDPRQLSVEERRNLEAQLYRDGLTQAQIADLVGVSQAAVSIDLRLVRGRYQP